ncbi:MAG: nicotinate-nucleotide--dimethylbenzimidazole phosphoribosyltransferase [Syntrophaceae bacterium]|nr:nicotinate-nucleotide--dimethylbenzimidazole phosphoribosyltransferase [Syntrophaceae bacterium]
MKLLQETLAAIVPQDADVRAQAQHRIAALTMPYRALGRLLDLAEDLAGITRSLKPPVTHKAIFVMAGDHGVVTEGVSKYPQEVTPQMVANFVAGGAGINALARQVGALVTVVDIGVAEDLSALAASGKIVSRRIGPGTKNIAHGPAMTREEAIACLEAGIACANDAAAKTDIFGTGDMGIGNTTPSSAIVAAFSGLPVAEVTGHGTGIDAEQFRHKIRVIEQCLKVNQPNRQDGLDVLAKIGGFEIGGIAGLCLGGAALKKPVVVDGFISTAGALIAHSLCPTAAQYMIAAHRSVEQGHRTALEILGKQPLIDLDLRLGEGTGAALAMNFLEASVRILTEMATFDEAQVSKANP